MTANELAPDGPTCAACGIAAGPDVWLGHWQRRLTPIEVEVEQAIEQGRRDAALLLADPAEPPPDFGPLPDCADYTRVVFACTQHAIHGDAAAHTHQNTCCAPNGDCDCTPEPLPTPAPAPDAPPMPPGW